MYQLRALTLNTLTLYSRQKLTLAFTVLFPVLLILFVALLQVVVNNLSISDGSNKLINITQPLNFVPVELGMNASYEYFYSVDATLKGTGTPLIEVGTLTSAGNASGLLGDLAAFQNVWLDPLSNASAQVPFFEPQTTYNTTIDRIQSIISTLYDQQVNYTQSDALQKLLPDGIVVFDQLDATTLPNSSIPTNVTAAYRILYNDVAAFERNPAGRIKYRLPSMIQTSITRMIAILQSGGVPIPQYPMIILNNLPFIQSEVAVRVIDVAGIALFPFAVSFLTPVYMHKIVLEKQTKLRTMMQLCGLNMATYWTVSYFFDVILYLASAILFSAAELISGASFFKETAPHILFLLFFLWGLAQISMSYFFASFISRTRTATVLGYLIVIISVASGEVLFATIYQTAYIPWIFQIYPLFSFYRAVYLMWVACYGSMGGGKSASYVACPTTIPWEGELSHCLLALGCQAVVYLIAAILIDKLTSSPESILRIFKCTKEPNWVPQLEDDVEDKSDATDSGVRKEDRMQQTGKFDPKDYGIVIRNLCKVYAGKKSAKDSGDAHNRKFAVDHLNLAIRVGECFALLGENGAGKTTAINILTGLVSSTSGFATVAGFDVRKQISEVHKVVGVCMQFDTLWPSLSCEEHLLFFTRLKGTVPRAEEKAHVASLLELFELNGDKATRPSEKLSGGMRRRLSVAIALAGDSKVVFLDEPSGGLDIVNRRLLWSIISKFTREKCVILTTHEMEEADTLCDRVGVMSRGKFVCIGDSMYLKKTYGQGYRLQIAFSGKQSTKAEQFVSYNFSYAKLLTRYNGAVVYQIPEDKIETAMDNLHKLAEAKAKGTISDWGLNQSSLEDVFINVIKRKDKGRSDEIEVEVGPE